MTKRRRSGRKRPRRTDPVLVFGLVTFGLALAVAGVLWWLGLDPLLSWLIGITGITLLAYGYDREAAKARRTRVPEAILLALTLVGGTAGAFVGMRLFHHKTAKASFQLRFWLVAFVQLVVIIGYIWVRYVPGQGA